MATCCGARPIKSIPPQVLLLNSAPSIDTHTLLDAIVRVSPQSVRITPQAKYIAGELVPADVLYPHPHDRMRRAADVAVQGVEAGRVAVMKVHDAWNAQHRITQSAADEKRVPVKNVFVTAPLSEHLKAGPPETALQRLLHFALMHKGTTPEETPEPVQSLTRKQLVQVFRKALKAIPTSEAPQKELTEVQQKLLLALLGLDKSESVAVTARQPTDAILTIRSPKTEQTDLPKLLAALKGSNTSVTAPLTPLEGRKSLCSACESHPPELAFGRRAHAADPNAVLHTVASCGACLHNVAQAAIMGSTFSAIPSNWPQVDPNRLDLGPARKWNSNWDGKAERQAGHRILFFVRHGQYRNEGSPDDSIRTLTDLGIRQAQACGATLSSIRGRYDRIWSSTLIRAKQTAQHISSSIALRKPELRVDPLLIEGYPCNPEPCDANCQHWRMGHSDAQRNHDVMRLEAAFQKLCARNTSAKQNLKADIIVSHAGTMGFLISRLLQLPPAAFIQMSFAHCTVVPLEIHPDGSVQIMFGVAEHADTGLLSFNNLGVGQ
eukprot:NODE_224_length_1862_cov_128.703746_g199_i0.p1 GENE.NODE_224_length_1862_cov_128.703746_g199_i0~~NODE_224_length_1862_cov_128.703746_g199_i0.p1  ORF type:complete len:576 (-),score=105.06 NODE_224_length_1862_cov_128.703746_g199_i0:134-1780(-)